MLLPSLCRGEERPTFIDRVLLVRTRRGLSISTVTAVLGLLVLLGSIQETDEALATAHNVMVVGF